MFFLLGLSVISVTMEEDTEYKLTMRHSVHIVGKLLMVTYLEIGKMYINVLSARHEWKTLYSQHHHNSLVTQGNRNMST
jgi:hypothetical protein